MKKIKPQPNEKIDYQTDFPNLEEVDFERELGFVSKVLDKFDSAQEEKQNSQIQPWNAIDMFGLSISSQVESLDKIEATLHRVIQKHQGIFNHELKMRRNYID